MTDNTTDTLTHASLRDLMDRAEKEGGLAAELVVHIHHLLRAREHRRTPYPDCKLQLSFGTDGCNLSWEESVHGHIYSLGGMVLSFSELAWIAEVATYHNHHRSRLLDQLKLNVYARGLDLIDKASNDMAALKAEYEKAHAIILEVVGDAPLPEPHADVTKVVEGPPLPGEMEEDCKWCTDGTASKSGALCFACNGSRRVWVKPSVPRPERTW